MYVLEYFGSIALSNSTSSNDRKNWYTVIDSLQELIIRNCSLFKFFCTSIYPYLASSRHVGAGVKKVTRTSVFFIIRRTISSSRIEPSHQHTSPIHFLRPVLSTPSFEYNDDVQLPTNNRARGSKQDTGHLPSSPKPQSRGSSRAPSSS
jgi:hypothetical protein